MRNYHWLFGLALGIVVTTHGGLSHAAGTFKFCPRWTYSYVDMGLGENYLASSSSPYEFANGAGVYLFRNSDYTAPVWSGYLSASGGCTPSVPGLAGTYQVWLATTFQTGSGAYVDITGNSSESWDAWRWYLKEVTLSAQPDNTVGTVWPNVPTNGRYGQIGAVVSRAIRTDVTDARFVASGSGVYTIYAEQPAPGVAFPGYDTATDRTYLGSTELWYGQWPASWKHIIGHELGHHLHTRAFGTFMYGGYDTNEGGELCQCGFVTAAANSHCLQSKELRVMAQEEGLAHFSPLDLFNNPSGSTATFNYYKEACNAAPCTGSNVVPPPVTLQPYPSPFRWLETVCTGAQDGKGTELDWMQFFYDVNNKGTSSTRYSFSNIASTYHQVCGGMCNYQDVTWNQLYDAVGVIWSTEKRNFWRNKGTEYGVAH